MTTAFITRLQQIAFAKESASFECIYFICRTLQNHISKNLNLDPNLENEFGIWKLAESLKTNQSFIQVLWAIWAMQFNYVEVKIRINVLCVSLKLILIISNGTNWYAI